MNLENFETKSHASSGSGSGSGSWSWQPPAPVEAPAAPFSGHYPVEFSLHLSFASGPFVLFQTIKVQSQGRNLGIKEE